MQRLYAFLKASQKQQQQENEKDGREVVEGEAEGGDRARDDAALANRQELLGLGEQVRYYAV